MWCVKCEVKCNQWPSRKGENNQSSKTTLNLLNFSLDGWFFFYLYRPHSPQTSGWRDQERKVVEVQRKIGKESVSRREVLLEATRKMPQLECIFFSGKRIACRKTDPLFTHTFSPFGCKIAIEKGEKCKRITVTIFRYDQFLLQPYSHLLCSSYEWLFHGWLPF